MASTGAMGDTDVTDGPLVDALKRELSRLSCVSQPGRKPELVGEQIPVLDRALLRDWYRVNHEHNDLFEYDMSATGGRKRGRVLIINNKNFTNPKYPTPREGTEKDEEALKRTLGFLGFSDIRVKADRTAKQMDELIKSMAAEDYSNYGCSVVAIFSHGEEDMWVCGTDTRIEVEQLIKYFGDSPKLAGKPKIFLLQCCQGTQANRGLFEYCSDGPSRKYRKIAAGSDMLIAWSTLPGEYAFRSKVGSWFIQSFCDVMDVAGREFEFQRSLTRVCHLVSSCYESQNKYDPELNHKKQSPLIMSTLTKELYFS